MRIRNRSVKLGVALFAAVALAATACGGDADNGTADPTPNPGGQTDEPTDGPDDGDAAWDALVAEAEQGGSVTIYSDQNVPNLEALKAAFEAEYDITLTFVRGLPVDLHPRVETELSLGRGEADVYTTADIRWMADQSQQGSFIAPEAPNLTNIDADLVKGDYVVAHGATVGFGWNTDLMPDGFADYEAFLTDDLQGLIGIPEPTAEALVDFYLYLEEQYGEEYVERLAELRPRIYAGGAAIIEAMVAGEVAATLYASPIIENSKADGAPVEWGRPDVAWGAYFNTAILKTAPNPAAAQVLVNFILSDTGQAAVGTNYLTATDHPASLGGLDSVSEPRAPHLAPDDVEAYRQQWRSMFQ